MAGEAAPFAACRSHKGESLAKSSIFEVSFQICLFNIEDCRPILETRDIGNSGMSYKYYTNFYSSKDGMFNTFNKSSALFVPPTFICVTLTLLIAFPAQAQESASETSSGYRLSAPPDRREFDIDMTQWIRDQISAVEFQSLTQNDPPVEQDRLYPDDAADRALFDDTPSDEEVAAALFKILIFAGGAYLEAQQKEPHDGFYRAGVADPWDD